MIRFVKGRRASDRASGRAVRACGRLVWLPLGLVVLLLVGCGQAEPDRLPATGIQSPHAAAIDEARALLDSIIGTEAIPGLSVAIGRGSQLIWSEGFGYSDMTHNVMVTPLTKFRIGSVSKPITAAALAILVEAGALDLNAPVQDYVPSFPEKRWPVTTRQLAGHLGGIRHYRGLENFSRANYPTVLSGIAIFADDLLINEPGTEQAETLETLFTSQRLRDGTETGYGLGWRSTTNGHGETIVSHTGGSVGGRTVLTLNRDSGLIVAIVANLSSAPMSNALAGRVEELFRIEPDAN